MDTSAEKLLFSIRALSPESLAGALDNMILSPSGWRGIFAASGNEEDSGDTLSAPHGIIAAAGAAVFAAFLASGAKEPPTVILARDSRPTGKSAAFLANRVFCASGCRVLYAGIAAAPEIMCYARALSRTCGFCYISASHNPIGHNGLKFGLEDGGVLEASLALGLIADLRNYLNESAVIDRICALLQDDKNDADDTDIENAQNTLETKRAAFNAYRDFGLEVSFSVSRGSELLDALKKSLTLRPFGIAADFNGSARAASIDRVLFTDLGIDFYAINERCGAIAHAIIPEGESLEPCRRFLEEKHAAHPYLVLGYVPDCDGDRGNLVIWDESKKTARSLDAQETFALACAAELAHLVWTGALRYDKNGLPLAKTAVVVNGPTSMRIDRIAAVFGAEVFRAEVGEANVVNLARSLRAKGYLVRILGEGSNGGNITHPSAVRDPIATVFALVKLLAIRTTGIRRGFFRLYLDRSSVNGTLLPGPEVNDNDFSLSDIIAALPVFYTTGVATPEAKCAIRTQDHSLLKRRYQTVFTGQWEERKKELGARFSITAWEARFCSGTEERRAVSDFGAAGTGGLKIVFFGKREAAFIWMRGSKTEPVFRIMADAENSRELERYLIAWQRDMITAADNMNSTRTGGKD
ncbi:MAG: phosphatidylglycerol lysyltransferase [Treponema sp.]|jgi:phosphoglucomutase|nr:phosphatidylglycerol lysyltransferase [Treponema sp.]